MARPKQKAIEAADLGGFKHFKAIRKMLDRLHDVGFERDTSHNRDLFMDGFVSLYLLWMFNPICSSLRALRQASELEKVQKVLKTPRASLGSLSESAKIFDSKHLVEIIKALGDRVRPMAVDQRLDEIQEILTLVDGTHLSLLPKLTEAMWHGSGRKGAKAHVHFELLKGVPVTAEITDAYGNEKKSLKGRLERGRLYVTDRGYMDYTLFQEILDVGSSFVCRLQDNVLYQVVEEHPVEHQGQIGDVLCDVTAHLGTAHKPALREPVRILKIKCSPHTRRGGRKGQGGPSQKETITLATNRFDLSSETIALVFKERWSIETYFKFFKHILGCRHLISHSQNGIELQVYSAIIACMLIALWTGKKPTLRTYEMLCWYFVGMASLDELQAHIDRLKKQD